VPGAARLSPERAIAELLEERDELHQALRLVAHRTPWDGECCWCAVAPFDNGSTRAWEHDVRCREIKELLGT
jgi:hypothetical protein